MRAHNRLLLNLLAGGAVILVTSPASASAQAVPRSAPPTVDSTPAPATAPGSSSTQAIAREMPAPATFSAPATYSAPSYSEQQPVRSAPPSSGSAGSTSSGGSGNSGSSTSGGATSRGGGSTSTSNPSTGSSSTSAVRRGTNSAGGGPNTAVYVGAGSRDRDGRTITGNAVRRASPIGGGSFFDERWLSTAGYPFSPWGRWYPWYSGGWGYGWVSYDPWRSGGTRWVFGRYGTWWYGATPWYDPWYDPGYGWYGMSYGGGGGGGGRSYSDDDRGTTGSLRLKVNPSQAKVYIDGVFQGVVDDFDGLRSPLDVGEGMHQLEIRGNGFVTLKDEITIEAGKTQTYRGSLKKSK